VKVGTLKSWLALFPTLRDTHFDASHALLLASLLLLKIRMDYQTIISSLAAFGERQFVQNDAARDYISTVLDQLSISYTFETYDTDLPVYQRATLTVDGVSIPCQGSGLVSGEITSVDTLLSSLISSQKNLYDANINFNPRCTEISRSNHYFAPALSVVASDVSRLLAAEKIHGVLEVNKRTTQTGYFLLGNIANPQTIVFSHFDSIGLGAVDNASGVALAIELIKDNPKLLEHVLFVIDGNEELSYDEGIYWGHGYRVFEERYIKLIDQTKSILVLDSFGYSTPELITDVEIMTLALPIKNIQTHKSKMKLLSGSYGELMNFYHAANDQPELINDRYWQESKLLIEQELLN